MAIPKFTHKINALCLNKCLRKKKKERMDLLSIGLMLRSYVYFCALKMDIVLNERKKWINCLNFRDKVCV